MPKKSRKKVTKKRAARKTARKDYVVVKNRSYGKLLEGTRIYFEGPKPRTLRDDGRIKFGKHILETLKAQFPQFRWIITPKTDSIQKERGIVRVRTSLALLGRMGQEGWDRVRDIKKDIVRRFFSIKFPSHFKSTTSPTYVAGTLTDTLSNDIIPKLSSEDRDALTAFLPEFVASESVGAVNLLKASAQIETLKGLANNLKEEIDLSHGESWWQTYIKKNILLMQQGYIKALDRLNVAVGNTKLPDFVLVTHDNYLDILEIKKPNTRILRCDESRGNYFWDTEVTKAISQTENYIERIARHGDAIRTYLRDNHDIDTKAVRPRGIILVGDARNFEKQKERDDFRLLSQGIKNITILTYDELLTRLKNYITVLEEFGKRSPTRISSIAAKKRRTRPRSS